MGERDCDGGEGRHRRSPNTRNPAYSGVLRPGSLTKIVILVLDGNASLGSF